MTPIEKRILENQSLMLDGIGELLSGAAEGILKGRVFKGAFETRNFIIENECRFPVRSS